MQISFIINKLARNWVNSCQTSFSLAKREFSTTSPVVPTDGSIKVKFCMCLEPGMLRIYGNAHDMCGIAVEHEPLIGVHDFSIWRFVLPDRGTIREL